MNNQRLYAGERYRHYKGNLYQIVAVAMHTETEEDMVVYQALYGDYKVFARPLKMFFETVKDEEGNEVPRFAKEGKCLGACDRAYECVEQQETVKTQTKVQTEKTMTSKADVLAETNTASANENIQGINPLLIEFLDAESSVDRLEVLHRMRKNIDHKTISDIAAALDIVIEEKDMDERIKDLENCLQTRARFETTRLR